MKRKTKKLDFELIAKITPALDGSDILDLSTSVCLVMFEAEQPKSKFNTFTRGAIPAERFQEFESMLASFGYKLLSAFEIQRPLIKREQSIYSRLLTEQTNHNWIVNNCCMRYGTEGDIVHNNLQAIREAHRFGIQARKLKAEGKLPSAANLIAHKLAEAANN